MPENFPTRSPDGRQWNPGPQLPHSAFGFMRATVLAALVAGCATVSESPRPALELPQQWQSAAGTPASAAGERWWSLYADPALEALVDEALRHNADLELALGRVLEARALAGLADADRYPVVSASFARDRTQSSLAGTFPLPPEVPRTQNRHRASLDASYEIDLWGKYRRLSEAARAELLAAESAQAAVRLSLVGALAQQYFALVAADAQEATLRRVLESRAESLALQRRRLDAGLGAEFELRQAEAEVAASRAQLAAAVEARERSEAALAVLLGRSPRAVIEARVDRASVPSAAAAPWVPAGLPSDLLLRRPDLVEAEQRLIAADARIAAARSAYFPSIVLTAFLGSESVSLGGLFSGPAGIFQFAAAVTQPIFNAGRVGYAVDVERARQAQALAVYRQAVAGAFRDVRDALAAQTSARQAREAQAQRAAALQRAYALAKLRYAGGVASQLELLDVERNLLQAELARIDAERAERVAVADLFKALGGGWAKPS